MFCAGLPHKWCDPASTNKLRLFTFLLSHPQPTPLIGCAQQLYLECNGYYSSISKQLISLEWRVSTGIYSKTQK